MDRVPARLKVFIYRSTCILLSTSVPGARMTTVRAKRRSCVYGVKKSLEIPKTFDTNVHLIQMFHCSMEE